MSSKKMFQVSTLQALSLGYNKAVLSVEEFLRHGNTGLGTFEGVDGEMIIVDGICYQADQEGKIRPAAPEKGVPFAVTADCSGEKRIRIDACGSADRLKEELDLIIDAAFELNSMHIVRLDGRFDMIDARSESGMYTNHVELKDMLAERQKSFLFKDIEGSVIAVHFPDYMDGINAAGWHLHFISADRSLGGHVFNLSFSAAEGSIETLSRIEIMMPTGPSFDTYDLKRASQADIKKVEQGEG